MLKNYFKIALRNLWKNKGYSAINIIGLSMGIATCLLITLYVLDELSFDRYNKKADRIYRINADIKFGGDEQKLAVAPDPMAFTTEFGSARAFLGLPAIMGRVKTSNKVESA